MLRLLIVWSLPLALWAGDGKDAVKQAPLPPAQVLLVGVFHFAGSSSDLVQWKQINVMEDNNQAYLEALCTRLASFNPDVVLLEYNPQKEEAYNRQYRQYLEGSFELSSNEIYQLGFRIAKLAGLDRVHSFDERQVQWNSTALFQQMPQMAPDLDRKVKALIKQFSREAQRDHKMFSLQELLQKSNDPFEDRRNKDLYLLTNGVGAGNSFIGADAAASWWHRNFRMYANIQKHALPGKRVLVVGGQGHTAILRDFLATDQRTIAIDVQPFL